ncbi:calpain-1 catalytic subunit-like [Achroia grisella]|uniref:calpain-1 catalytic subunit-like n=1 Tax=Achroia grisella TaxID=688607 RepID=UPI0027D30ADB|nr:calpain-1 catalytic subunit-like [Achroia grisella]
MKKFVRTRGAEPHRLLNGHASAHNGTSGVGVAGSARGHGDHLSTLSRYWSESEGSGGSRPPPPQLWEDAQFPATWRALGDKRYAAGVRWMRPHELCARPSFLGDETVERRDAGDAGDDADSTSSDEYYAARWEVGEAGEVSDAHVCGAVAALALTPRLLSPVCWVARVAPTRTCAALPRTLLSPVCWVACSGIECVVTHTQHAHVSLSCRPCAGWRVYRVYRDQVCGEKVGEAGVSDAHVWEVGEAGEVSDAHVCGAVAALALTPRLLSPVWGRRARCRTRTCAAQWRAGAHPRLLSPRVCGDRRWEVGEAGEVSDAHVCGAVAALALTPRLLSPVCWVAWEVGEAGEVSDAHVCGARGAHPALVARVLGGVCIECIECILGEAGEVSDAHVCGAVAALALTPRLLARVAPPHSFRAHYCGAFSFRFWIFDTWREVTVDDRLPTRGGRLLGSRAALADDFTLPLLEKAYAKLYGSYRALREGSSARALQDLTGGIVQSFCLRRQPRALTLQVLHSAVPRSTLVVAAPGAACVTGLARARGAGPLVRLRAPAPRRPPALPAADRELLQRADHPADFWMSFADFAREFSRLELVHVGPDDWTGEPALHARRPWRAVLARRRWRAGYNAGGPPSCRDTTGTNPRFHVQIPRAEAGGARKCHVVVSVTQQYAPAARRLHAVGFAVYELPAAAAPRPGSPLGLRALDVTHESRAREVVTFFTLPPGQYLVVPHTRRPHTDAAFLLRILTDQHTDVWEVNEDNMIIRDISSEFLEDEHTIPAEIRAAVTKFIGKRGIEEVDAARLRAAARAAGGWRPSLEACRALVALRDAAVSGRVAAAELPALLALVAGWRLAFLQVAGGGPCGRACSSYRLRALLYAAGLTASNKVLECLVLRYARRSRLSADACVLALARLHLAHERYRSLDTKLKSNPLSLEEMILMTIYS